MNDHSLRTTLQNRRVLIVDDSVDTQRLLTAFFTNAGADVVVAEGGQLAVEAVEDAQREGKPFHAISMDIDMPSMTGFTATRKLRTHGYQGPIIAVTCFGHAGHREMCHAAGCDDHLTKPVIEAELIRVFASCISRCD